LQNSSERSRKRNVVVIGADNRQIIAAILSKSKAITVTEGGHLMLL